MNQKQSIPKALLAMCFCFLLAETQLALVHSAQTRAPLAGSVVFPKQEHDAWLQIQENQALEADDKVISTINTYFLLKLESWLRGTLLDFGFVFNLNDNNAWNDYAYERGIFHVNITGWKLFNMLLTSYEYQPEFLKVEVDGDKALVHMLPEVQIPSRHIPGRVDPTPWSDHTFELVLLGGQWLIQKITCIDPFYYAHPRGTDFDKAAESLANDIKKRKAKIKQTAIF